MIFHTNFVILLHQNHFLVIVEKLKSEQRKRNIDRDNCRCSAMKLIQFKLTEEMRNFSYLSSVLCIP